MHNRDQLSNSLLCHNKKNAPLPFRQRVPATLALYFSTPRTVMNQLLLFITDLVKGIFVTEAKGARTVSEEAACLRPALGFRVTVIGSWLWEHRDRLA